jgi:PAS domain S-box-containing protein
MTDHDSTRLARTSRVQTESLTDHTYRLLVDSILDYGIFMLDPNGHITSWNKGAQQIKGYSADEIIGRHFSVFYPPESVAAGWPDYELEFATANGRFEDEGWRLRKDGTPFWANVVITAIKNENGTLQGFVKVTRDLTERKRQDEMLRMSEERFRLLVEGVKDYAIYMINPDGTIASWNEGATHIKGYSRDEVIGKNFAMFYTREDQRANRPWHLLEIARKQGRAEERGWHIRKDGTTFIAHVIVTALRDSTGELRGYAKVTRDLTQTRRIETLEKESRRINEFLAMLAHELRNPLASIRNTLSLMELGALNMKQLEWCRSVIDRQTSHLTRLVDDLLDVSRITSGKVNLNKEEIDLITVINRGVEGSMHLIQGRGHTLSIKPPEQPVRVIGDATRLIQVVSNLLNNAAKYTENGGLIEISTVIEDARVGIRVKDNGIGISEELLGRVFDLFQQGERTVDRKEGGLGIGLTLVETIAMLHGGSVDAKSDGFGQGSEFTFWLPKLPEQQEAPPLSVDAAPEPDPFAPMRVLIVDDNRDAAESMAMLVEAIGNSAKTVHEGLSAAPVARRFNPQLVLLDIGLPGMNGYEVAKQFKSSDDLRHIKLVAVTGYGQEQDRKLAEEAGFDDFLVKPVTLQQLNALTGAALRSS